MPTATYRTLRPLAMPTATTTPAAPAIRPKRFSVDDYYRMAEVGIIAADERVELLRGEVVDMSPIGIRHGACVDELTRRFILGTNGRAHVRIQGPVRIDDMTEPEPDVALLKLRADGYRTAHPTAEDVLLIIEVADTSLEKDRMVKLPIYAEAGIPEVWIVDLAAGRIEVYRSPRAGAFSERSVLKAGASTSPLAFPDLEISSRSIIRQ